VTVVIADDEHLVRFGLKSMLEEWDKGLHVVAEVATGDDLVAAVAKHQPDLCFVDIRMPGLNGLAAIRKARKAGSRARWIILTSHAEFDYASEALSLGATAYLLKPAGPANLTEVLTPVLKAIERERRDACVRFEHALVALRCDVAAGLTPADRAAFAAEVLQTVREESHLALAGHLRTAAWLSSSERVLFTAAWEDDDAEGRAGALRLRERLGVLVKATAGEPRRLTAFAVEQVPSWDDLQKQLEGMTAAEGYRCYFGLSTVHALGALERRADALPEGLKALAGPIEDYLATREKGQIAELEARVAAIRHAFAHAERGLTHLDAAARYLAFRTGLVPPETGTSLAALVGWVDELAASTRAELPDLRRAADSQTRIVERVEAYLREHLETEIRVPDIASELGLSPNYLSAVYSKLTGATLIERLSDLRLDRARELLDLPGSRVKVVASQVGYKSTRYFAQLYFKRFGHHPSGR
jgi:two-component system response regulator YesN